MASPPAAQLLAVLEEERELRLKLNTFLEGLQPEYCFSDKSYRISHLAALTGPTYELYQDDMHVATVAYQGVRFTVNSHFSQFDAMASRFREEVGGCLFINHNLETLIGVGDILKPFVFIDTQEAVDGMNTYRIASSQEIHFMMKEEGWALEPEPYEYEHGGIVIPLRYAPRRSTKKTVEAYLPVDLLSVQSAYMS